MSEKTYGKRHGGPYDRGAADSYYDRPRRPHFFLGDTYKSTMITEENMSKEQIEAYNAGYNDNEELDNKKGW